MYIWDMYTTTCGMMHGVSLLQCVGVMGPLTLQWTTTVTGKCVQLGMHHIKEHENMQNNMFLLEPQGEEEK